MMPEEPYGLSRTQPISFDHLQTKPLWSTEQEKLKARALEILKEVKGRVSADSCALYLNQQSDNPNNEEWIARAFVVVGEEGLRYRTEIKIIPPDQTAPEPEELKAIGITARVIHTGEAVLTEGLPVHPDWIQLEDQITFLGDNRQEARGIIVPVRDMLRQIIGAVRVDCFAGKPPFEVKDLDQVKDLAHEFGVLLSGESFNLTKIITSIQARLIRKFCEPISLQVVLEDILHDAENLLNTDACSIYLIQRQDDSGGEIRVAKMEAGLGYHKQWIDSTYQVQPPETVPPHPKQNEKLGLTGWVISTGYSYLAKSPADARAHPHWLGKYDAKLERELKLAAYLAVPIRDLRGQIIGALKAERLLGKRPFSIEDQVTLEALAQVVGRSISYLANIENEKGSPGRGQNASIVSWALDLIQEAAASEGEMDAFLDLVARVAAATALADGCSIFLKGDTKYTRTLTQRAGYGNQRLRKVIRSYILPEAWRFSGCEKVDECDPNTCPFQSDTQNPRLGLTVWIAMTGKSFYAPDFTALHKHCHHRGEFDPANFQGHELCGAWYGVPLKVGGEVIGVLKIENKSVLGKEDPRTFSNEVQRRIQVLAAKTALEIERLQLQGKDRDKVIRQAKPAILKILNGALDLPALATTVVEETARLFNARACALFLKEGNSLIQPDWAATGWATLGKKVRRYELIPLEKVKDNPQPYEKVGLTVWIAVKRLPFMAKSNLELKSFPHHKGVYDKNNFQPGERCESFMGFPLLFGDELIGVLKIETKTRMVDWGPEYSYFNEQDELVFELISSITAAAVKNVLLLEETRLVERVRGQTFNDVFDLLCRYVQGREEVVPTLRGVEKRLDQQDPARANSIRTFINFLSSDFNLRVLEETRDSLTGPLHNAFNYLAAALKITNLGDIPKLQSTEWQLGDVLAKVFVLNDPINVLYNTLTELAPLIEKYFQNPDETINLAKALEIIRKRGLDAGDMYLLERSILKGIFKHWEKLIEKEEAKFRHISNPYVAGPPLAPNSPVFYGRNEFFDWIEENICDKAQPSSMVLHGGWHTGKTSILKQLQAGKSGERMRSRQDRPIFPVYIDMQGLVDNGNGIFLYKLADEIYKGLVDRHVLCPLPDRGAFLSTYPHDSATDTHQSVAFDVFDKFLDQVGKLLEQNSRGILVLMLDEFEMMDTRMQQKGITDEVILTLRSKIQNLSWFVIILAGRHRLEDVPELQLRLFNVSSQKEVGFFSKDETAALICDPVRISAVEYDQNTIDLIFRLTNGYPFFIQQICEDCIYLLNKKQKDRKVTLQIAWEALDRVLKNNPILEQLWKYDSTEEDRKVLLALGEKTPDLRDTSQFEPGAVRVGLSGNDLALKTGLPKERLTPTLNALKNKRLIAEKEGQYRLDIEILSAWIKLHLLRGTTK